MDEETSLFADAFPERRSPDSLTGDDWTFHALATQPVMQQVRYGAPITLAELARRLGLRARRSMRASHGSRRSYECAAASAAAAQSSRRRARGGGCTSIRVTALELE